MRPPPLRPLLAAGALLGVVCGGLLLGGRQPALRIVWPAVGGDGALVLAPDGTSVLIDGGADAALVAGWLGQELPFGRRRIDVVVLTRADRATLPGQLAALRRYEVGAALYPDGVEPSADFDAWQLLAERAATRRPLRSGDAFPAGGCTLAAPAVGDGRAAVVLRCGEAAAWFLQSIDDRLERELPDAGESGAALLVWPWLRRTDGALPRSIAPAALIFAEGAGDDVVSWQARRIGAARLLHEQLDGRIEITAAERVAITTERAAP